MLLLGRYDLLSNGDCQRAQAQAAFFFLERAPRETALGRLRDEEVYVLFRSPITIASMRAWEKADFAEKSILASPGK